MQERKQEQYRIVQYGYKKIGDWTYIEPASMCNGRGLVLYRFILIQEVLSMNMDIDNLPLTQ